ncbi:amino acid transporter [Plasmodium gonderi]|uniref:Amino acid transporter n=1 Tax=Plasmodium gonderi TaxID=77519 RepID=A0A1Y1JNK1_PLAGO|nr:amino acid transporter [Plasmodium gonderi]GAW82817.1 amino acid transporter [Plasmodium gonderi]
MGKGHVFCKIQMKDEKGTQYKNLEESEGKINAQSEYEKIKTQYNDKKEYIEKVKRLKENKYFGNKTIGNRYSYVYLINQIFGSGIVSIPYMFKSSGWLPCLITNILICLLTIFNTLLFLRAMTMIPNNIHFNKRYEYISTVCYFLGKNNIFFWIMQICYYASILASNIISIVIVSHAMDYIIINFIGYTVGFTVYPNFQLKYIKDINVLYYGRNYVLCVTVGYLINAIISIYFSQSNLEDNMKIQLLSFIFLMSTIFQMIFLSSLKIYRYNASRTIINKDIRKYANIKYPTAFGDFNFKQLLSSYISSYSAVTVIPCWANEMKSDVKIIKTVWISNLFCCFVYYIFGYILCTAYPDINNDNILYDILQNPFINVYMKICIYLFDLLTIAPGIYVYCIATRYNLINSNICSEKAAFILGTIFPFLISWLFTSRAIFENIFTWSSLIFSYACNFITPPIIYLIACKNIPYSKKNPLHHTLVLYDPKEYKMRKSIYNIFYLNDINNEKNTINHTSTKFKNEEQNGVTMQHGVQNNLKIHPSNHIPLKQYPKETPLCLPTLSHNKTLHTHFLNNNGNDTNIYHSRQGGTQELNNRSVLPSHEEASIKNGKDINVTMVHSEDYEKCKITQPLEKYQKKLLLSDEEKPMENHPLDDFIIPVKVEPEENSLQREDQMRKKTKKKKSVSLRINPRHVRIHIEDASEAEAEIHGSELDRKDSSGVNKGVDEEIIGEIRIDDITYKNHNKNSDIYHKTLEENEKVLSKKNVEKKKKNSSEYHRGRKKGTKSLELRKYHSMFSTKGNNSNLIEKHKNNSSIRRSRKHKTVMGFEKKNKKYKNIFIKNEHEEFSDYSDITDYDLLNDKIIADLSRDIYNDIKIIKSNYERDEYLIKYSDIFDSFLNLKLLLENNTDEQNDFYDICNTCTLYKLSNTYNSTHGHSLGILNTSSGDNTSFGHLDSSAQSYNYDTHKEHVETLSSKDLPIQEWKFPIVEDDKKNGPNTGENGESKSWIDDKTFNGNKTRVNNGSKEEGKKSNELLNRITKKLTKVNKQRIRSSVPNGENQNKDEMEEAQNGMCLSDIYEDKLSDNIKNNFHMFINRINNKKNLTWAFDGNKNEDEHNLSPNNNNHVNVSNVENIFHSNENINLSFRKSKTDIFSYSMNSCKNIDNHNDYVDEINGMALLSKLHSCRNCPIKDRKSEGDLINLLQTKSVDNLDKYKFSSSLRKEKEPVHFSQQKDFDIMGENDKHEKKSIEDTMNSFEENYHTYNYEKGNDIHLGTLNNTEVGVTTHCSYINKYETFPLADQTQKKKFKKNEDQQADINRNNDQSKDRFLYFLNSYNRKKKMYKDVNTLTVPDNVYNVIPKINKGNEQDNFDDTINNIFNYYKYNFLLSFSEKNNNVNRYKNIRNSYWTCSYVNKERENNSENIGSTQNCQGYHLNLFHSSNEDVISYNDNKSGQTTSKKMISFPNLKCNYVNKFQNDEKKEPLLMSHEKENQCDDLPTINLICPEKPLHGYEDAYQIDDYVNGEINENIIHVYPSRYLRIKHAKITEVLLFIAVLVLLISVLYDFTY